MQKEADEHYEMLVQLQIHDEIFDKMLQENHNRKQQVEKKLSESKNWQRFIRKIDRSLH